MKQCPICKNFFEPKVFHQTYDRLSCRNKAERRRAVLRDKGLVIEAAGGTKTANQHIVPPSIEATVERLEDMVRFFRRTPTAYPVYWANVPETLEWIAPEDIMFGKQMGGEHEGLWLMCNAQFEWPRETATHETPTRRDPTTILDALKNHEKENEMAVDDESDLVITREGPITEHSPDEG